MSPLERFRKLLRPLGAAVGLTGAAALLVNRSLRAAGPLPLDHIGGVRRPMQFRDRQIFVTELGSGSPILLVHGIYAGASSFEFRKLAPLLAQGHRVVALDLLGCGLSEMPDIDYSPDLFVDQIVAALSEFADEPVTLVASSLGAAFAIVAATRAPAKVRRLVLCAPAGLGGVLDGEPSAAQRALGILFRSPLAGESAFNGMASPPAIARFLRKQTYASPASVTPEIVQHYYAVAHQAGARFVPAAFVGGALNCNVARDLPFVEAPILVLWGERASSTNPFANAQEYLRLAKDARLVAFANSGLLPHEEEPEKAAEAIESFIDAKPAAPAEEPAAATRSASPLLSDLQTIFKSYDVRGIYPTEFNDDIAYGIGRAFVEQLALKSIVVGRDMRPSGEKLFAALARGANDAGADVTDIGLVSTDALYFAVGRYGFQGGVMITASHNPADYNGMKFTREQAQALSLDTGLDRIRDQVASGIFALPAAQRGTIARKDVLDDFAAHCLSFVDPRAIKPFTIAIDAGNGMAGLTVPHVFSHLPCRVIPLFFELDGTFPNHPASPIEPENMIDLQKAVIENKCDLGVAFDGDADRMFIVDEKGGLVGGDMVTALVAINMLKRNPGAKILYNLICSRSVPEAILRAGGLPVRSPVGHSLIKKIMRDEDVLFGGEHSGHFYFRDNWFADSGMIALLQCLEVFSDAGKPVSEVVAPIDTRFRSGEINSHVRDIPGKLAAIVAHYHDGRIDHLDGVTVSYPDWWMNVRPSNTEPLLRLNVEGDTKDVMERQRDDVLALIRS
ncbi:MAG TPA: alpha/beta fold hydrolase [Candidatus Baltobacteraceae bacterium]|nr:alpha/beta fold hydrolase [Candidatus Baltobacteraceae bacterium]